MAVHHTLMARTTSVVDLPGLTVGASRGVSLDMGFHLLLGVVTLSVVTLGAPASTADDLEPFTLEEFLNGTFDTNSFDGTWLSDTLLRYENDTANDFTIYNVSSDTSYVLVSSDILEPYNGSGTFHSFSGDGLLVAISYEIQKVYRHSRTARYDIYDTESKTYLPLDNGTRLQAVVWAGDRGVLWVKDNDIYYRPNATDTDTNIRITSDGISGAYFNGIPDWVYEEEVLSTGSALWPSSDGSLLAFPAFSDENVERIYYFKYGEPGENGTQYPTLMNFSYPKVGTPNPQVYLKVVSLADVASNSSAEVNIIDIAAPEEVTSEHILFACFWSGSTLLASWTNRVQNFSIISICNTTTGNCTEGFRLSESQGWVDPPSLVMHSDGLRAAAVLPYEDRPHLAIITFPVNGSDASVEILTEGNITVISVLGWDEDRDVLYYTATALGNPAVQHAYRVAAAGGSSEPECLSCITSPEGNTCTSGSASLSTGFSYGAILCYGPDPAFYGIYDMQGASGPELLRDWDLNEAVRARLTKKKAREFVYLWEAVDGDFTAQVQLTLPPDMDKSGDTKYPMLVYVYGGPDENLVTTEFDIIFNDYLTSSRGIISAYIDGRGSGKNGRKFLHSVYRRFGTVEIEDQIAVTRKLQKQFPYIDSERTAIWGWSYGGFSTAHAMAMDGGDDQVFCCGISVAPVTSFIYYDTIYTERYMGLPTPEDNLLGYNGSDVTRRVDNIRNKKFLLIHGNADDNVHYQQSMELSRALEEADIMFQQQSYPDEAHSLSGVLPHLYRTMDDFWTRAFNLSEPEWQE